MQPLPLQQWDESLDHVIADMNGRPLNVHGLMANHPDLLNAWWDFRNYAVQGGALAQRDCELLILRVAVRMQCWYEWASHVVRGKAAGLTVEEIKRVQDGPGADSWSHQDRALLQSVDDLFDQRRIATETQEKLNGYFAPRQILDIIAIYGVYVTLGCVINTWDTNLDESVHSKLSDEFSRRAFEDRVSRSA